MNDRKIISAIAERDEQMLAFAVRKYSKLLWKTASPILANAASAEDVEECVADVFIYLWQHPEKYDPEKGKLSSWLAMAARSRAIDRYRREVKRREDVIEESVLESMEISEREKGSERKEILLECINEIGDDERELIIRRYYYEQKPAEIASALGIPKKQVENRLYYTKQKLKSMMEKRKGD